jgi:hypothetical protein
MMQSRVGLVASRFIGSLDGVVTWRDTALLAEFGVMWR